MTPARFDTMSNIEFGEHMRRELARIAHETDVRPLTPFVVIAWVRCHPESALHSLFDWDSGTDAERADDFEFFELENAKIERRLFRRLH